MRLPGTPERSFSVKVNDASALKRLESVELLFAGVKIEMSRAVHVVNGKVCRWATTNIRDNPKLLEQVEKWVNEGTLEAKEE